MSLVTCSHDDLLPIPARYDDALTLGSDETEYEAWGGTLSAAGVGNVYWRTRQFTYSISLSYTVDEGFPDPDLVTYTGSDSGSFYANNNSTAPATGTDMGLIGAMAGPKEAAGDNYYLDDSTLWGTKFGTSFNLTHNGDTQLALVVFSFFEVSGLSTQACSESCFQANGSLAFRPGLSITGDVGQAYFATFKGWNGTSGAGGPSCTFNFAPSGLTSYSPTMRIVYGDPSESLTGTISFTSVAFT